MTLCMCPFLTRMRTNLHAACPQFLSWGCNWRIFFRRIWDIVPSQSWVWWYHKIEIVMLQLSREGMRISILRHWILISRQLICPISPPRHSMPQSSWLGLLKFQQNLEKLHLLGHKGHQEKMKKPCLEQDTGHQHPSSEISQRY